MEDGVNSSPAATRRSPVQIRKFKRPLCEGVVVEEPILTGSRGGAPCGFSRCVIAVGASLPLHAHPEREVWVLTRGHGVLSYEGVASDVSCGDMVFLEPNAMHQFSNTAEEPLELVSIYWA